MRRYQQNTQRGVTLLELLIVVAIIGMIAAISTPNFITLIRHHRLRANAIELLEAIRLERSRALSLNRRIRLTVNTDTLTYRVERLEHVFYDPMQFPARTVLIKEADDDPATDVYEVLVPNAATDGNFNRNEGIQNARITSANDDTVLGPEISITFHPSGTIEIPGAGSVAIKLSEEHIGYVIEIYKAGQISLFNA